MMAENHRSTGSYVLINDVLVPDCVIGRNLDSIIQLFARHIIYAVLCCMFYVGLYVSGGMKSFKIVSKSLY